MSPSSSVCIQELTFSRPSEAFDNVRFTVYASFELEPMLGIGEALHTSGIEAPEFGTHRE